MKVPNSGAHKTSKQLGPKGLSQKEIAAKIQEKFGDKAKIVKAAPVEDKVEINTKKGVSNSTEEGFGDIQDNDPTSSVTRDKLKDILKTGAFSFNEKERKTLAEILK